MIFRDATDFVEASSQRLGKVPFAVLADGQAAAFFGTVGGEGADHEIATRGKGAVSGANIVGDLGRRGEKVEGGAVMP